MCSDCCDYTAPVANGPYAGCGGRAGSNLGAGYYSMAMPATAANGNPQTPANEAAGTGLTPEPETTPPMPPLVQ